MENKTINTVFLGIIIILLAAGVWFLAKQTNAPTDTDQKPVVEEKEKPPVVKKDNPTIAFLKGFVTKNPNARIAECSYQGNKYFNIYGNTGMADGLDGIYDAKGVQVAFGGGFVPENTPVDPLFAGINPTCTKVVYLWMYNETKPSVDIYNLK